MALSTFKLLDRIAIEIGLEPTLQLAGFFGGQGRALYVPLKPTPGHVIEKVIGEQAFADLCMAFPGESVPVPQVDLTPLRNAGRVWWLRETGLSAPQIANLLGISKQRVGQIQTSLRLEGYPELASVLSEEEETV